MRITVATVGRAKAGSARDLFEDYAGRLRRGPIGPLSLKEVEARGAFPPVELRRREAELLRAAAPAGARLIALDERGQSLTSADFAAHLGRWRDAGAAEIACFIGGAEGLDEAIRREAALVLSLGPMTWPHLLVRALLAEQLFRANCILTGHPYHRG
ncbi:MAG: 23S rRNA (pseudouridine(1915)-N(3))-methyltransferase RlmH [Alphaproteobacteria bacterium]